MGWRILSQILEFMCHLRSDDISAVTQVLKSLDEDHSSPFDGLHEEISPVVLGSLEEKQGKEQDGRREDNQQMKKPDDVDECLPYFLRNG